MLLAFLALLFLSYVPRAAVLPPEGVVKYNLCMPSLVPRPDSGPTKPNVNAPLDARQCGCGYIQRRSAFEPHAPLPFVHAVSFLSAELIAQAVVDAAWPLWQPTKYRHWLSGHWDVCVCCGVGWSTSSNKHLGPRVKQLVNSIHQNVQRGRELQLCCE